MSCWNARGRRSREDFPRQPRTQGGATLNRFFRGFAKGRPESRDILQGWKQIGDCLGVTARTAQEWEKTRGLPIRRISGQGRAGSKPTVFAVRGDLEGWLSKSDAKRRARATKRAILVVSSVVLVALFLLIGVPALLAPTRTPFTFQLSHGGLAVESEDGTLLWKKSFDLGEAEYSQKLRDGRTLADRLCRIVDLNGDASSDVLFLANPISTAKASRSATLMAWDRTGKAIWEGPFNLGRPLSWSETDGHLRQFSEGFFCEGGLEILDYRGDRFVLVVAVHSFFPTQLALINGATGRLAGEYWHPGRINAMKLIQRQGDLCVLIGGINNPGFGQGQPFLAIVPISGLMKSRFNGGDPFGFNESVADPYFLLIRPDIFLVRDTLVQVQNIEEIPGTGFRVGVGAVWDDVDGPRTASLFYYFDEDLLPTGIEGSNVFYQAHRELELEGKLDHHLTPSEIRAQTIKTFHGRNPNGNQIGGGGSEPRKDRPTHASREGEE